MGGAAPPGKGGGGPAAENLCGYRAGGGGPYPFFEVYHQPVYVSVLWAVGLLGVNYLYAWLLWHLGGGRPRSAR